MAPGGVTFHSTRMFITASTSQALREMNTDVERGAQLLATADVDVIAFACTTGSLIEGPGYDRALAARISAVAGCATVTTSTAVLDAFAALGVRSLAVATPYTAELNEQVRRFLEGNGFVVAALFGLNIVRGVDLARVATATIQRMARDVDRAAADAVFLSCTNFPAAQVADTIENELGKPVVTSNQATLWAALRRAGIRDRMQGFGRLLAI
jgi:maleate cis-trans isomerase